MKTLIRIADGVAAALLAAATLCLAGFTLAVVYTVAARYLFSATPYWAEELPRLLLMWSTFLAVATAAYRNTHLRADLLDFLPLAPRARCAASLLGEAAVFGYLVVMVPIGWQLSMRTMALDTTALQIPSGLRYLPLPIGFAFAGVLLLIALAARYRRDRG